MSSLQQTLFGLLLLAIATIPGTSQKANKSTPLVPVSGALRCPDSDDCLTIDRIQGDGLGTYTGSATTPRQGMYLSPDLYFTLQPGLGRFLSLDFGLPLGTPPCVASSTCRKTFGSVWTDALQPASLTNPVDALEHELPNGLSSLTVGQSAPARFKLNFADPNGRALLWTIRFNAAQYPGSTNLTVTRTATNRWIVEASGADIAELVSTTTAGKSVTVQEGWFSMPFKIVVTM